MDIRTVITDHELDGDYFFNESDLKDIIFPNKAQKKEITGGVDQGALWGADQGAL